MPSYRTIHSRFSGMAFGDRIPRSLPDLRVWVDAREEVTPGFKFNDWELRGVPLRIEVGPRDVAQGTATLGRRDLPGREGKMAGPQEGLAAGARGLAGGSQGPPLGRVPTL